MSKEEVEGKSKVLQKVGRSLRKGYWTSTPSFFSRWFGAYEFYVDSSGTLDVDYVNNVCGVRPVLKSDNLDEIIKNCKSETKDGVQIVEYGRFPLIFEEIEINNPSFLQKTGKA